MSGHPARGYTWPPFEPGNPHVFKPGHDLSLRHGAYSPRRIDERAELLVAQLLEAPEVAFLRAPEYRASLWRYAQRQARADLLHGFLLEHGEECRGCAVCESLERRWREFDTAAAKASERLGLDPLSRARLGRDVAAGRAADAVMELTRLREEHERAERERGNDGDA